jgi:hypothetical protein
MQSRPWISLYRRNRLAEGKIQGSGPVLTERRFAGIRRDPSGAARIVPSVGLRPAGRNRELSGKRKRDFLRTFSAYGVCPAQPIE